MFFTAFGAQAALGTALSVGLGLPASLKWLDEGALAAALLLAFVRVVSVRPIPTWKLQVGWALAAYSAIAIASGLLNDVSAFEMAVGWRSLGQFFLFYVVLAWLNFGLKDLQCFFSGFLVSSLLHLPLALRQATITDLGNLGLDDVTGGFGAGTANLFGYFCALVVLLCLCLALVGGRRRYWLIIAPITLIWVTTSAIGSYIAFGLMIALGLILSRELRRFAAVFGLLAVLAVGAVALNYVLKTEVQVSPLEAVVSAVTNLTADRIDDAGNPGRVLLLLDTIATLAKDRRTLLFGFGTGSVGTLLGEDILPSNMSRFTADTDATFVSSSVIHYTAELGLFGISVILLVWTRTALIVWRARAFARNQEERAWSLAALLAIPFLLLAGFGEVAWSFQAVAYPVWALVAYSSVHLKTTR